MLILIYFVMIHKMILVQMICIWINKCKIRHKIIMIYKDKKIKKKKNNKVRHKKYSKNNNIIIMIKQILHQYIIGKVEIMIFLIIYI